MAGGLVAGDLPWPESGKFANSVLKLFSPARICLVHNLARNITNRDLGIPGVIHDHHCHCILSRTSFLKGFSPPPKPWRTIITVYKASAYRVKYYLPKVLWYPCTVDILRLLVPKAKMRGLLRISFVSIILLNVCALPLSRQSFGPGFFDSFLGGFLSPAAPSPAPPVTTLVPTTTVSTPASALILPEAQAADTTQATSPTGGNGGPGGDGTGIGSIFSMGDGSTFIGGAGPGSGNSVVTGSGSVTFTGVLLSLGIGGPGGDGGDGVGTS
ncbi:hypothetical protein FGB62_154g05 [Gracilaria domingensis]|nr:hypothetical protein FGB62_154g05 [Gracilaria domingensis]